MTNPFNDPLLQFDQSTLMFQNPTQIAPSYMGQAPSMANPNAFSFNAVQATPQTFGQGVNYALNQTGLGMFTPNTPQTGVLSYDSNLLNTQPQQLMNQPIQDPSMTTMDWLGAGMGAAQMGLGWFMGDRKLDLAEDQLSLKRKAYADQRADQARLDQAYTGYGK